MDIKQLHALLVVAEVKSVTRAAEVLNIVQPAVSRQLRLLEEDLGAPLFERTRQGMVLTENGGILVEYARRALHELARARAEIQPDKGEVQGIVTVGLLPSTAELLSGTLLSKLRGKHPKIRLRIVTGYTGYLQQWLESGEVDSALLYDSQSSPTIQTRPLLAETLWLVGLPQHQLQIDQSVELSELHGKDLILPNAPHSLRTLVDSACLSAGISFNLIAETNSMRVQRSLVLAGQGYTILPGIAVVDDLTRGLLSAGPLAGSGLQRRIVLATTNTRRITPASQCVLNLLEETIREAVCQGEWQFAHWLGIGDPESEKMV